MGGGRGLGGGGRSMGGGRSLGGGGRSMGGGRSLGGGGGMGGFGGGHRRPVARRGPGFGTGLGLGLGMGMLGGRRRGWGWGGGWGRRRGMGMGMPMGGGGCGGGCMGIIMAVIMLIVVMSVIGMMGNIAFPGGGFQGVGGQTQVTRSTINRTPLDRNAADTGVPRLVDDLGMIGNTALLNRGMDNFHNRTGVRPILYITDNVNGITNPTIAQLREYAESRYLALTGGYDGCGAHMLVLVVDNVAGDVWITTGAQARTVIDEEAYNIVLDYIARHWGTDASQLFSRAFDESSERIMRVDRSPWIPVLIVAGILLILLLLFTWWKRKQAQKNLEAEQTERILSQPLETMGGDDAASQLARQYEDE